LGWLGLHVDEEYGGSGFGLPELVVVIDELGRAVAPGPFVPTVTVSAVLSAVGNDEQKTRLLPGLVDGTLTAAVGFGGNLTVSGGRLSGDAGVVIGAGLADVLLLASGEDMILVDRTADGVAIEVPGNLDRGRRSGHVVLTDVAVGDNLLPGARNAALARTRTLYAAEAVGGASDCVDSAVEYAKVREQFGRTIATFQAVKHHCANMLVAAESAVSCVWDAARAAGEDEEQFRLTSAVAATLALPAYVYNAELSIQVHGGIGFTWEHDAHLHLRRALTVQAVLGGDESATDVFDLTAKGIARANSLDLPAGSDELRTEIRAEAQRIAGLDEKAQLDELIATGYLMPHWPKPWGLAAGAVEQLLCEEEFAAADVTKQDYGITGWVILTLIQHGTPSQIERFVEKALRQDEVWCQLFSEPGAGSDLASLSTKATKVDGGWRITGQKIWTTAAQFSQWGALLARTDPSAPKHNGITYFLLDMKSEGVEVKPLRELTGNALFNTVYIDDVFVPDEMVLGEVDRGWEVSRNTLTAERVSIGSDEPGFLPNLNRFVEFVGAGSFDQVGHHRAGELIAEGHAAKLLNMRSTLLTLAGGDAMPSAAISKLLSMRTGQGYAEFAVSSFGTDGAIWEQDSLQGKWAEYLLASRATTIYGGTSEVQLNIIAERLLGLPRDP